MRKIYTAAPLPFMGQKRRFLKDFREAIKSEFSDNTTFIDLFGGSGLLSHTVKRSRPECFVIYNDYDNFEERLNNVSTTNKILQELRLLLKGYPEDKVLLPELKNGVLKLLKEYEKRGFVDYITLSSSLLFSMKYATSFLEISKQSLYNCIRKNDYCVDGYLDGIEVTRQDYRILFNFWHLNKEAVFLVDPPYLSTDCGVYKNYWRLRDYLDVLKVLRDNSYIYFTSNKSSILELCEWLEENLEAQNPFSGASKSEITQKIGINTVYQDIMLVKNTFKRPLKAA